MADEPTAEMAISMPDYLIRHATLRQLQVFEAIVRQGSFTRAAQELFLTQPTVSMQVKKLTEAVGVALFEPVGRNVRPTEAGLDLYQTCREIFASLTHLESKIADLKGLRRGRLRLGVVTTAKYVAPEMLGEFSSRFPQIELSLKVTNRDRILDRIQSNEDDLYIMGEVPDREFDVAAQAFAPNPLVAMAPRAHPLVGGERITLKRFATEPFIVREPGSGIRDATLRLFASHGVQPKVRMELGSNEAIKHAIVGGLGVSVLSLHTLTLEGVDGPVAILDVEGFPIPRKWYMVYPRNKELSVVSKAFLEYALERESFIRTRLEQMWPPLAAHLDVPE